jgi:hypothetical protein
MAGRWTLVGRQGDIYVYRLNGGPSNITDWQATKSAVVARGEKTGHQHVLAGEDLAVEDGAKWSMSSLDNNTVAALFAKVGKVALLTHEEHAAQELEPGTYAFVRQREVDWEKDEVQPVRE